MRLQRRSFLALGAAAWPLAAPAQGTPASARWPTQPVRLIVPNAPGGGTDTLARLMQGELQRLWGQQVLVDYKPGAGTMIGTDYVAKSAPDGYTLGMVVTSHVINPALRKQMPYDTLKDLAGVMLTARSGVLMCAAPSAPFGSLKELIAHAKAHPGRLSYATPGAGSSMHLGGELLKQKAGFEMLHIPYKGSSNAYADVTSGRVDVLIDPLFSAMPQVASGRLKPIAVMSGKRDPTAPQIPAAGELIAGFEVVSINGIVAPAATPRALVQRIRGDLARALASPDLQARLRAIGLEPVASTPEQFDQYVATELQRWQTVVRNGNISVE